MQWLLTGIVAGIVWHLGMQKHDGRVVCQLWPSSYLLPPQIAGADEVVLVAISGYTTGQCYTIKLTKRES